MKLQPDRLDVLAINAYGEGWVAVNGEKNFNSVVIGSRGEHFPWECAQHSALTPAHFERLAATGPELVIFGSGRQLRFVKPALLASLMAARIGVETMDTLAACRTYNILAGEGRHVVAALLIEGPDGAPTSKIVT